MVIYCTQTFTLCMPNAISQYKTTSSIDYKFPINSGNGGWRWYCCCYWLLYLLYHQHRNSLICSSKKDIAKLPSLKCTKCTQILKFRHTRNTFWTDTDADTSRYYYKILYTASNPTFISFQRILFHMKRENIKCLVCVWAEENVVWYS